jgi:hypothetical protein
MSTSPFNSSAEPSYVPDGYKLRSRIDGAAARAFGPNPDQVELIYTTGWQDDAWAYPLLVCLTPVGPATLAATERHPGQPTDIAVPGATAVYHDGLWALGPGEDERRLDPQSVIHWDRIVAHSVTVVWAGGVYAVRGAKTRGVGVDELVRVVKSLPY